MTLSTILLAIAFLCFVLAAIGIKSGRINLTALGLAIWVLASLVGVINIR